MELVGAFDVSPGYMPNPTDAGKLREVEVGVYSGDYNDNHADADPELMRLIAESDDVLAVSSDPVFDRWMRPL